MEKRSFETSNWFLMGLILALAVVGCAAVKVAMAGPPDVPPGAPLAAIRTVAWQTAQIAADTNTTANLSQNYAYHDIFCSVDIHTAGGVTITVQSSPAGTTYYDTLELWQIIADTDVFSRVVSYGRYERLEFDVNDTGVITPTCTSIYNNNWSIASYASEHPHQ